MHTTKYELFPGSTKISRPFFESSEKEEAFHERWAAVTLSAIEDFNRHHALSELESMTRRVD